ncbi:hotdog fold thioesterase [Mesonia sp.]|uniref:PaaI family thioesterase n=1 Tax=Mesonia sp. TaxID=1960830 RepID=UPI001754D310|nr:hotdog fold thioesterase [Mesonia sp.]HIB37863.1 hotdog fold thioesterase [Mesonia sp.]HIO27209.1 hotdog fold thioesterase [Flavobacteriaceae bacterium]
MKEDNLKPKTYDQIPNHMLSLDAFSQWLGIELVEVKEGYCKVQMTIRKEMLNSMGKAHGGITFSLADTAFGFASNTHGRKAVSIDCSINHIDALEAGDVITAESEVKSLKNKVGFYMVEVKKEEQIVALFKGVVYRTSAQWD